MGATTGSGSKRPRSPVCEDVDPKRARFASSTIDFLKESALDFALEATGLKRSHSAFFSEEDGNDSATKKSRQQDDLSKNPSWSYAGLTVHNSVIATIDADGKFVTLGAASQHNVTSSSLTPPRSPNAQETEQDPIALQAFKRKAGLDVLSPPITPAVGTERKPDPLDQYGVTQDPSVGSDMVKVAPPHFPQMPENHVIIGDVDLFGCIPAKLHIFRGQVTKLHPYQEVVQLSAGQITIGSVLPPLKDGPFDAIVLENTELCYSVVPLNVYELEGLYLETDLLFKGPLQPLQDVIRDVFNQERPALHVSAHLGMSRDWMIPYVPPRLVLRGSFDDCSVKLWDILEFTQLGVELTLEQARDDDGEMNIGYGFFGKVDMAMPGSVVPLKAEYLFRVMDERYMLSVTLKDDDWKDCFGIKNLTLSEVTFVGVLSEPSSKAAIFLQMEAVLHLNDTTLAISDEYSIAAYLGNLNLQEVGKIFNQITGHDLDVFDHDVVFNSLSLVISNSGVAFAGAITINGHSTAYGSIAIMQDGLQITGGIGDVEFESIQIKRASFDVFISSSSNNSSSARTTKFGISGEVSFSGIDLSVGLFTEKATGSELQWTIYGEVAGDLSIGNLDPDLKGSFLDVSLKGLALIASNKEDPDGPYNKFRYPVRKGIQFCAVVDRIPQLEDLMRGSVKGMILCASYETGTDNLRLSVILPAERTISFGEHVYTGPIAIEFAKEGTDIVLIVKALLNVNVDTQPEPLKFSLGLKAGTTGAAAYATMLNEWVNPAKMGKEIKIKGCSLEFGIVYATFFTTGVPGAIGFAGQLMLGQKEAKLAMKLSQNPKDQVLAAAVTDLGVVDLVQFASKVCEIDFPEPPKDLLHFNKFDLYLSTGASIGEIYFPAGASLSGDMLILGKKAKFDCTVGGKGVKLMATIEHFDLGPLKVKGATGEDPIVDIELSADKQRIFIDGAVELWDLSAALHLETQAYPTPAFDFWVKVELSDWFKFNLAAQLTGDIDFKDLSTLANSDFAVSGEVEQHILENIIGMLDRQINSMAENTDYDAAKRRLSEKENEYNSSLQAAQSKVDDCQRAWEQKQADVKAELERAKAQAAAYLQDLGDKADAADKTYVSTLAAATAYKEQVCHDASVAIREAESAVYHADHDSDDVIRQAQDELHRKRDALNASFGKADADVESAQQTVDAALEMVEALDKDLSDVDRRISEASLWDMPLLVAEKTLKATEQAIAAAGLEAARLVLMAAEGVLEGPDFIAGQSAVTADEDALEKLLETEAAAIEAAKIALEDTKKSQGLLVSQASQALYEVERSSSEIKTSTQAKAAVATGEETARSMVSDAQRAFDELKKSAEYIALEEARKDLAKAQGKAAEVELARQACQLVAENKPSLWDEVLDLGAKIAKWLLEAAGEIINITKISFSGSSASFKDGGPPLKCKIEGKLVGEDIDIDLSWKPDFDIVKFIKAIFSELWEMITEALSKFFEGLAKLAEEVAEKVVEFVEDAGEFVVEGAEKAVEFAEDVGEVVVEGAEKAVEAIGNAASDVGHAVEDFAEDVDDAMSDVGSTLGHAASDVGHAVEDFGEGIDDAVSDVGSAIGHVADDVGDAVEDVGHAVENVASDIGDAIGNVFSSLW
ncbi:hypothetical protein TGAM01_v205861 [Trichoderma gamsii]|uniref:Uncharacterized protein n=1 Tax=Trichoderma gamsii TaxID=398673 RepID=A0A2P4ZLP6_9HYPO|nr:hypothetical protein TGAM01_v205861 [Trichoderma gamsii]PON25175.1 hypothetical protein TGAM01_v205861 [Trichoderma gamsii]